MAATEDMYLPSYEELTVPDINVSSPVMKAGARHMGKYCLNQCNEFMLCLQENGFDHRVCLNEGKEVTRCGLQFFQKLKKSCYEEFTKYWQCVDRAGGDMNYNKCRKTQGVYDKCVFDNFNGQENPPVGYFSKIKIYESKRPKPPAKPSDYPEETPGLDLPEDLDSVPDPPELKYKNRKPMIFA